MDLIGLQWLQTKKNKNMKQLLSLFLFLLPCLAWAQYPSNGNQKITLGEQSTADGLIWRGRVTDTTLTVKSDTAAYFVLDTVNINLYTYKASATGQKWRQLGADTAAIAYVNTYGMQTVNGAKTFSSTITGARFDPTSSSASGNGMYLPSTNTLGFSTNGTEKMRITSTGNLGLGVTPSAWNSVYRVINIGTQGLLYGRTNQDEIGIGINWYRNQDGQFLYNSSAFVSLYLQFNGEHIFYNAPSGTAGNTISFNPAMTLKSDSELQIAGTTDRGAYNLQVNGTGVWGGGAYFDGSDFNIKNNIEELDSSLYLVNTLKPVTFKYDESYNKDENYQLGFIAQDVFQNFENKKYVNGIVKSDGDILSMSYSALIPILTKAIQEQQALIKALEQRIINLENK
jgi:hypothetical protein